MVLMLTAEYFKERRLERGLSVEEVARRLGCKRLHKAVRRVKAFEEAGYVRAALLGRLATVLGIDETTLNRLAFDDYRYWFALMNFPVVPCLLRRQARRGGAVRLPKRLKTNEAREKFAADYARRHRTDVCLTVSARVDIWFSKDGTIREIVEEIPDDTGEDAR